MLRLSSVALLATSVVAMPRPAHELTAPILKERNDRYATEVSFAKTNLTYGSTDIGTIFASLNNICTADLGGCDTAQGDVSQVTVATKLYDGISLPATANVVLTPSAEFPVGQAGDFVNAVIQVAKAGAQCTTQSWRETGAVRSGEGDGVGSAAFCTMADYIQVNRLDHTTKQTSFLYVAASIQDVQASTFDWCSILSLAGTISGLAGDAGVIPAAVFGAADFVCEPLNPS